MDAPWVEVAITAENTNMNEDVEVPGKGHFSVLAGGTRLDRPDMDYLGSESDYEVLDADREFKEYESFSLAALDSYWDPPSGLVPDAVEESILLFMAEGETTVDELSIRLNHNDIRATWE